MKLLDQTKAIVFDAYGTLFDIASVQDRLEYHVGLHAQRFGEIWRGKQLEYTWLRAMMGRYQPFSVVTREALIYTCTVLSLHVSEEIVDDLMEHYLKLSVFEEIPDILATLRKSHQLAILSNADKPMLEKAVHYNQLSNSFDVILSADEVKTFKTTPVVYALAEKYLKLSKEEICFVSTNRWDVVGAKSFGFRVIWLNRHNQMMEAMEYLPDEIISSLSDLGKN